jgi:hypothetical protein
MSEPSTAGPAPYGSRPATQRSIPTAAATRAAGSELPQDGADRDPGAGDARKPLHHGRIHHDPRRGRGGLTAHQRGPRPAESAPVTSSSSLSSA